MTTAVIATTFHETPVYFPCGKEALFGIFTHPTGEPNGMAAIILSGGGATAPATNRNRLSVRLARRLAESGYHALRFDYHGIGESTGVLAGAPRVDEPYLDDVDAAVAWVRRQGLDRFVLVGACFGGRTALSYAPALSGLQALVLVSPPLRDLELGEEGPVRLAQTLGRAEVVRRAVTFRTVRGLFHPARRRAYLTFLRARLEPQRADGDTGNLVWLSSFFVDPLRRLGSFGVPVTFIYGTEDWHYRDFTAARTGRLGAVLRDSPGIQVIELDGEVHGLSDVVVQERVAGIVVDRLRALAETSDLDGPAARTL